MTVYQLLFNRLTLFIIHFSVSSVAEKRSIKNNKLCETKPISEKPKMNLNNYITKDYDNNLRLLTKEKQSQTKPISKGIRGMANRLQFRGLAL